MPHTILIVDDNDSFRGMLATVLGLRGYQTVVARNGPGGLRLAAERNIDAVLVDVEMPEMDGLEFCRQLREQGGVGRNVPVWIMTGALRIGVNRKAAAPGALLVLRKPLNIDETCAQFEQEFRQRTQDQPANPP
jgi:two-component system response regulator MprA